MSGQADGAAILDAVHHFLGRFVAYPSAEAQVAHTLWIAHAHCMNAWDSTPRIAFLSPEPGSGKTRALEATEPLVPSPIEAVNVSAAFLFRRVGAGESRPTILFDEIDTVFGPKAKNNEEIRGMLNAGHRRGGVAGRCVVRGKTIETEELPAYCAVAVAGLGSLPDTILTRSIVIRMRRRAPGERVEPYRRKLHAPEGNWLRDALAAWAATHEPALAETSPAFPAGVEDRNADIWEALLAIAEAAGEGWPERARVAAVALVALSMENGGSLGVRLLSDLRELIGEEDHISTEHLLDKLVRLEESPWGEVRGKPLGPRGLARLLRPYEIRPANLRTEIGIVKGYRRSDMVDAWSRYLHPLPRECATSATSATVGPALQQP